MTLLQYVQNVPIVPLIAILSDIQIGLAGRRWTLTGLSPPGLPLVCPQLLQHANGTEGHEQKSWICRITEWAVLVPEVVQELSAVSVAATTFHFPPHNRAALPAGLSGLNLHRHYFHSIFLHHHGRQWV